MKMDRLGYLLSHPVKFFKKHTVTGFMRSRSFCVNFEFRLSEDHYMIAIGASNDEAAADTSESVSALSGR
jgi:hypothetical protein